MKVLILGAEGQLGTALQAECPAGVELVAAPRSRLDLTDGQALRALVAGLRPAQVINAAAYTSVDGAEAERERAFAVNAVAPGALAAACAEAGARLLHVSTDFVFDGAQGTAYRTTDTPRPLGVYGASKLEGERRIAAVAGLHWQIVRTAWVYGPTGRNFLLTMLRLFGERTEVSVVCDQIGTPTSVCSLARMLWRVAADAQARGILHFTDAGVASWYDFALAILEEARARGLVACDVLVRPIPSSQYPSPARRPAFSVLDKTDTWARFGWQAVHWRVALREVLGRLRP